MYDSCLIDLHDVLKQYKSFLNILHSKIVHYKCKLNFKKLTFLFTRSPTSTRYFGNLLIHKI